MTKTAYELGLIIAGAFVGLLLLSGCVEAASNEETCNRMTSSEAGFWECMDYYQREDEHISALFREMRAMPAVNPLAYMPPRQTITCYGAPYSNTVTCY